MTTPSEKTGYSVPEVAKALGAFVVTLGTVATLLLADSTFVQAVPKSVVVVLGALVAASAVAGVVFGIPNAPTSDQVVKGAVAGGEKVVTEVVEKAKEAGIPVPDSVTNAASTTFSDLDQLPDLTSKQDLDDLLKRFES